MKSSKFRHNCQSAPRIRLKMAYYRRLKGTSSALLSVFFHRTILGILPKYICWHDPCDPLSLAHKWVKDEMKAYSLAICFAATAALSTSAFAQNLQYTGMDRPDALSASISVNGSSFYGVMAGRLNFTDGTNNFDTYCANALTFLNGGFNTYTPSSVDLSGASNLSLAGRILANSFDTATTADEQAGLQLALWSAIYDGGASFDANGTNFKVSGVNANALNFASSYYLLNTDPGTHFVTHYTSNANGAQNQLTAAPVPEPFTMLTLGAGALALGLRRRRKA